MKEFRRDIHNNVEFFAAILGFGIAVYATFSFLIFFVLHHTFFTGFIYSIVYILPLIVIGILLVKYRDSKIYDTKGLAIIYLLLIFITEVVNVIRFSFLIFHYNRFFLQAFDIGPIIIAIFAFLLIIFAYKKDILKEVITNSYKKLDIILLVYIIIATVPKLFGNFIENIAIYGISFDVGIRVIFNYPQLLPILSFGLLIYNIRSLMYNEKTNMIAFFIIAFIALLDILRTTSQYYYQNVSFDYYIQVFLRENSLPFIMLLLIVAMLKLRYMNSPVMLSDDEGNEW